MNGQQPYLLQETAQKTYTLPRLKHLPVCEYPAIALRKISMHEPGRTPGGHHRRFYAN